MIIFGQMQSSVWLEDVDLTKFLHQIRKRSERMGLKTRQREKCELLPYIPNDNLNNALGTIRVLGLERLMDNELRPHLITVLSSIRDKSRGAPEQVVISGVLPVLAQSLRSRGSQAVLVAELVSELANEVVRKGFGDSGLVPALLSVLSSSDQDLLVHTARVVSRMCYDNAKLQDLCLRGGAVPRLVSILFRFPERPLLEEACLLALCNLSGMLLSEDGGMVWERGVSVRPEECLFTGAPSRSGSRAWSGSCVTVVRVAQFGPGQYSVNMEVIQRCASNLWGQKQRTSLFSVVRTGSNVYKVIKHWSRNIPRTQSLKTRMFHTFL